MKWTNVLKITIRADIDETKSAQPIKEIEFIKDHFVKKTPGSDGDFYWTLKDESYTNF